MTVTTTTKRSGDTNDDARELATAGTVAPGHPVPTITALCRTFDCTRQTVAKALRMLATKASCGAIPASVTTWPD